MKIFTENRENQIKPPRGLFSRIIKRLGLEKRLRTVRKHLGFFLGLLAVFIFLSGFALIELRQVLAESGFGSYLRLLFSDPDMVVAHWHSFAFSVFESAPSISLAVLLAAVALLLVFVKLAAAALEKIFSLTKTIHKNKNIVQRT